MANASATQCSLVNTALVIGGVLSGSFVVGMTLSGANVPANVVIVSQSSGAAGQAGNYVVTANSANITTLQLIKASLYGLMPFVGNSQAPLPIDWRRAAGLAVITASSIPGPSAAPGAEYTFGTHAAALYNAQAQSSSKIYPAVPGQQTVRSTPKGFFASPQFPEPRAPSFTQASTTTAEVSNITQHSIFASPQFIDFGTAIKQTFSASAIAQSSGILGSEYTFGTHAAALYNAQAISGTNVWPSQATPPTAASYAALSYVYAGPQEQKSDIQRQPVYSNITLNQGWVSTFAGAAPQNVDLTLSAQITQASQFTFTPKPNNPRYFSTRPQDDLNGGMTRIFRPSAHSIPSVVIQSFFASPPQSDPFSGRVLRTAPTAPPQRMAVAPVVVQVPEQVYFNPQPTYSQPLVGGLPVFVSVSGQSATFGTGFVTPLELALTGIYDYFTLAQAMQDFSHRTDIANYQDYYIQQGETRIYRDLFTQNIGNGVKWLEMPYTGVMDSTGVAPVPSNYLALKTMQITDGFGNVWTLMYKDPQWMYTNYAIRGQQAMPAYIARDGANFVFGPSPDMSYTLTGTIYGSSTPISSANPTTWMTTVCPDLLFASCMIELQPFLKDTAAMKSWQTIYAEKLMALVNLDQAERVSAGTMTIETG